MDIFKVFGTIVVNNKEAVSNINKTATEARKIGKGFSDAQATSGKSLAEIAAANGKTVNQIRSEVAKAAAEYRKQGMTASEAMKKAYADIGYEAQNSHGKVNKEVKETENKYIQLGNVVSSVGAGIGKALGVAAKVGAVAMSAASTAIVAVGKSSLDAYAEYEQLAGGMAKIFSSMDTSKISKDAAEAYKFLGMSANEYLAVINDVGASFASTMGDEAGYEAAKKGLTAISDYASGTGKSFDELKQKLALITRSTSSYQSIADQFSGILPATSAGFLEQAQAAGILSSEYKNLTDVPIDEYQKAVTEMLANGVEALNLTGNTAAEASETISGSLSMAKSAWQNLLIGFADGNQDLDLLIDNFVTSVTTAAENIVPRLGKILGGLSGAIAEIIPVITEELPGLLEELLPGIIQGAGALIQGLIEALPELLPVLWGALGQIFSGIWDYIFVDLLGTDYDFSTMFSDLTTAVSSAWSEIQQTWNAIGKPIWDMISSCVSKVAKVFQKKMPEIKGFVSGVFSDIVTFWNENLQPCLQAIGDFIETNLAPGFEFLFGDVFGHLLGSSVEAGFQFIVDLWNNTLKPVFTGITDFLTGVFTGNWDMAFGGLKGIFDGFAAYLETGWNAVVTFFTTLFAPLIPWFADAWNSIKDWVANAVESMKEKWEDFKESVAEKIASVVATVTSKFTEIKQEIESKVNDAKQKAKDAFEEIKKSIQDAMDQAKQKVSEKWEEIKGFFADAVEVGKKIVDDIKSGIEQAWEGLKQWFQNLWDGLFGSLTADITVNKNDNTGNDNGHATGLNYVPYDEYPAILHRGEAVLNSVQARAWRSGEGASGLNQDVTNVLLMILDAILEGNSQEMVLKLNNREFGRAVRGVANV